MLKAKAIELLGGTTSAASEAIGISYQAVDKWPEVLPKRIAERVLGVYARKHLPPDVLADFDATESDASTSKGVA